MTPVLCMPGALSQHAVWTSCRPLREIDSLQVAQAVDSAKASCMINLAMASQRQEKYSDALTWTEKALRCCEPA